MGPAAVSADMKRFMELLPGTHFQARIPAPSAASAMAALREATLLEGSPALAGSTAAASTEGAASMEEATAEVEDS
jgi:hypothetical protein